jgi:hypothetical protein
MVKVYLKIHKCPIIRYEGSTKEKTSISINLLLFYQWGFVLLHKAQSFYIIMPFPGLQQACIVAN